MSIQDNIFQLRILSKSKPTIPAMPRNRTNSPNIRDPLCVLQSLGLYDDNNDTLINRGITPLESSLLNSGPPLHLRKRGGGCRNEEAQLPIRPFKLFPRVHRGIKFSRLIMRGVESGTRVDDHNGELVAVESTREVVSPTRGYKYRCRGNREESEMKSCAKRPHTQDADMPGQCWCCDGPCVYYTQTRELRRSRFCGQVRKSDRSRARCTTGSDHVLDIGQGMCYEVSQSTSQPWRGSSPRLFVARTSDPCDLNGTVYRKPFRRQSTTSLSKSSFLAPYISPKGVLVEGPSPTSYVNMEREQLKKQARGKSLKPRTTTDHVASDTPLPPRLPSFESLLALLEIVVESPQSSHRENPNTKDDPEIKTAPSSNGTPKCDLWSNFQYFKNGLLPVVEIGVREVLSTSPLNYKISVSLEELDESTQYCDSDEPLTIALPDRLSSPDSDEDGADEDPNMSC